MRFIIVLALLLPVPCASQVQLRGNVKLGANVTLRIPPLSLTSLSPSSGQVGVATTVTIKGTSLGGTQGTSTIDFGGVAPALVPGGSSTCPAGWTSTCLVVTVPASLSLGTVLVQVTVNGVNSNPLGFTVTAGPPSGNSISLLPTSGPVGAPVTITGMNFLSTGTVTFNGTAATPTGWTATSIVAPVPSGATTGPVVVSVTNGGTSNNQPTFTVTPLITVTGLSPSFGAASTQVTVAGNNFGATQGSSKVTLNGTTMSVVSGMWSNTSITVTVPSGAPTGPVLVTEGSYSSNAVTFTVTSSNPGGCPG